MTDKNCTVPICFATMQHKKNGCAKWMLFVLKNRLSAVIFEKDDLANTTNRFFTKQCWLNVAQNAIKTVHRINLFGTRESYLLLPTHTGCRVSNTTRVGFDTQTLHCTNLLFPQHNKKNGWTKWTPFVLKNRLSAVIFEKHV